MSDLHEIEEAPIPLLSDILVAGNLLRARSPFERSRVPEAADAAALAGLVPASAPEPFATPTSAETMAAVHSVHEPTLAPEPTPEFAHQAAHGAASEPVTAPVREDSYALYAQDADALVERLRGRALSWLTGEGRGVIEQRCSAAMQEHSHWIVGQVSREIGLALETELKGWVKAAVREELAARATHGTTTGQTPSA
ncbi:hypothetical protein F4827_003783 [Paraburkholderia bannensis]|uniref:DUF2486 family protein n=1 Tax=Paraburkholderia bannensis TaxID=765414 RepID=A0A7W9TYX2_9BURK|nr:MULTISPECIES: DUF2486 family protein [Paraburkholderia]MBB3258914.1 hypothetical protein [Paraburkholderia sp. WP4_3_2]MBB6103928.1 hypothetical protein [Paraburkholderia bannensis]